MRKLFLFLALILGAFTISAQEISTDQWTLATKKTADWCPFCGTWGWDLKQELIADQEGEPVLIWAVHHSGGLMTPTSKAMADNFPASGQPVFFVGEENMNVFASNASAKRAEINEFIASVSSFPPFAGVGSTAVFDGEKIEVNSKAKFFFEQEGGDYWLSSYLVKDELIAMQASIGSNAVHKNVLLHSFNEGAYFGVNIKKGAIAEGEEFTSTGMLDYSNQTEIPDFTQGYKVATILWSLVEGKYTVWNINVQDIEGEVSTKDELISVDVNAFHLGNNSINVNISSDIEMSNVIVQLFDIQGRSIAGIENVNIIPGKNAFEIPTSNLTAGTYIVNIQSTLGQKSIKVSIVN